MRYSHPMRNVTALLLYLLPLCAGAETVYRVVGPDGSVTFSDTPQSGAQEVHVDSVPSVPSVPATRTPVAPKTEASADAGEQTPVVYSRVAIVAPANDTSMWNSAGQVEVGVEIAPKLGEHDRVVIHLDGALAAEGRESRVTLAGVNRGTHTVSASIVDAQGRVLRSSKPVTFHLHKATVTRPR